MSTTGLAISQFNNINANTKQQNNKTTKQNDNHKHTILNMKKLLLIAAATLFCVGAFAQGKLAFDINSNNLIYITTDTTRLVAGDAAKTADNGYGGGAFALPGSSLYTGVNSTAAALGGTWVVSLMGGPSAGSLALLTTTTVAGADVAAGGINAVNVTFGSLPAGTAAFFQIDVSNGGAYSGQSQLFTAIPGPSVYSPIYQTTAPVNSTWAPGTFVPVDLAQLGGGYFGGISVQTAVPEPGTFALAGLGLAALLVLRRRS